MTLEDYINKKYASIKLIVKQKANNNFVDERELLSLVNLKLAKAKNIDFEHDNIFYAYAHKIVLNAAFDLRKDKRQYAFIPTDFTETDLIETTYFERSDTQQLVFEQKKLIKLICDNMNGLYFKETFEAYFLNGLTYDQICTKLNMDMANVKSHIFRIRAYVNKNYSIYNQMI